MLDRAGVTAGLPGCSKWPSGAGGQTLTGARRVGPDGLVVATDISPVILIYAARQATEHRLTNVETVEADGGQPGDLADGTLGAVICRLGVITCPTRSAPLRGMRAALRPGGPHRLLDPDRNDIFSVPVGIIRHRAGVPAPGPALPGRSAWVHNQKDCA